MPKPFRSQPWENRRSVFARAASCHPMIVPIAYAQKFKGKLGSFGEWVSEGRRVILLHQLMHCWLKEQLVPLKSSRQELGRTLLRKCYSLPLLLLLLLPPRLLFFAQMKLLSKNFQRWDFPAPKSLLSLHVTLIQLLETASPFYLGFVRLRALNNGLLCCVPALVGFRKCSSSRKCEIANIFLTRVRK